MAKTQLFLVGWWAVVGTITAMNYNGTACAKIVNFSLQDGTNIAAIDSQVRFSAKITTIGEKGFC